MQTVYYVVVGLIVGFLLLASAMSYSILYYIDSAECSDTDVNAQQAKTYATAFGVTTTILAVLVIVIFGLYVYYTGKVKKSPSKRFSLTPETKQERETREKEEMERETKATEKAKEEKAKERGGIFNRLRVSPSGSPKRREKETKESNVIKPNDIRALLRYGQPEEKLPRQPESAYKKSSPPKLKEAKNINASPPQKWWKALAFPTKQDAIDAGFSPPKE